MSAAPQRHSDGVGMQAAIAARAKCIQAGQTFDVQGASEPLVRGALKLLDLPRGTFRVSHQREDGVVFGVSAEVKQVPLDAGIAIVPR
jgi:hypothetical protein